MITNEQIVQLRDQIVRLQWEAGTAGDQEMVIITMIALEDYEPATILNEICFWIDSARRRDELAGMTREKARDECDRVINGTPLTRQSG